MLNAVSHFLRRLFRNLAMSVAIRHSSQVRTGALDIVDLTTDSKGTEQFEVVAAAIELVRQYDPRRLRRLETDVRRILLAHLHGSAGEYWHYAKAIVVDVGHVERQVLPSVAMTIVHEGTHARIERAGIPYIGFKERVERRCVTEEIAFARLLPSSEHLVLGAELKLASRWWETR